MSDDIPELPVDPVDRMVPLFVEVPSDQLGDMKPGNPVFDAAMECASRERPGAGVLFLPEDALRRVRTQCPLCGDDMTGWAASSQRIHHKYSHGPIDRLKRWLGRRA